MEYQNIKVTSRRFFNIGIVSSFALLGLNSKSVYAENIFRLMDMEPIKITVKSLKIQDLYAMPLVCLLYTSPSPRDPKTSRMPSSA